MDLLELLKRSVPVVKAPFLDPLDVLARGLTHLAVVVPDCAVRAGNQSLNFVDELYHPFELNVPLAETLSHFLQLCDLLVTESALVSVDLQLALQVSLTANCSCVQNAVLIYGYSYFNTDISRRSFWQS